MSTFIEAVRSAGRRMLWLDATDYAARLLLRGAPPWLDAAGYVAWQRRAHALLKCDVVSVPVARLTDAWVAADAGLELTMRTRRRTTYPLQTLLADAALREYLSSLLRDLRASFADRVLALTLPAPRPWLEAAWVLAHGGESPLAIDTDDAETAAMYVADFLRTFAGDGIEVVLIEESSTTPTALDAPAYQPLTNLAKHYRWDIGVRAHTPEPGSANIGIDFAITPAPLVRLAHGIDIDHRFWSGAALRVVPDGSFLFAQLPADAVPEQVLERLAVLRAA